MKITTVISIGVALLVGGCAAQSGYTPERAVYAKQQAVTVAHNRGKKRLLELLGESMPMRSSVAARSADCGYWHGEYWRTRILQAEIHLGGDGTLAEQFSTEYNDELAAQTSDVWDTHCDAIYPLALDLLADLNDFRRF